MSGTNIVRACVGLVVVFAALAGLAPVRAAEGERPAAAGGRRGQRVSASASVRLPDLDVRVASVKGKMTLARVGEIVREATKANVVVDAAALEAAGHKAGAEFELDLRDVRVEQLLRIACRMHAGPPIAFACEEDLITITLAEKADAVAVTRMYPVADLLLASMKFDWALADAARPRAVEPEVPPGGGGAGGGGGGLFGGGGGGGGGDPRGGLGGAGKAADASADAVATELTGLLKQTIARESWVDNGGRSGSIHFFAGVLVVTQTSENQRAVAQLIDQLRENVKAAAQR